MLDNDEAVSQLTGTEDDRIEALLEQKEQEAAVALERYNELARQHKELIQLGGINKDIAISIENYSPGLLSKDLPISGFTSRLSKTNYDATVKRLEVSMEDVATIIATIIIFIIGIIAFIIDIVSINKRSDANKATIERIKNYTESLKKQTERLRRVNRMWDTLGRIPKEDLAKLFEKLNKALPEMIKTDTIRQKVVNDVSHAYQLPSMFIKMDGYIRDDLYTLVMQNRHQIIEEIIKETNPYKDIINLANNFDKLIAFEEKAVKIIEDVKNNESEENKQKAITDIRSLHQQLNAQFGYTVDGAKSISNMLPTYERLFRTPLSNYRFYFKQDHDLDPIDLKKSPMTIIEQKNLGGKLETLSGKFEKDKLQTDKLAGLVPLYGELSKLTKEIGIAAKLIKAMDAEIVTYNKVLIAEKDQHLRKRIRVYEMALEYIPSDADRKDFQDTINEIKAEIGK